MAKTTGIEIALDKLLLEEIIKLEIKLKEAYEFIQDIEGTFHCGCSVSKTTNKYEHRHDCLHYIANKYLEENK